MLRGSTTIVTVSFEYLPRLHYLNYPDLLPCWPRSSVGRASEDLIRRSWVQTPRGFKPHRGHIFFKGRYPGDLVYRQYCLLPAPYSCLNIYHFYFTGATRFHYYKYFGVAFSYYTYILDTYTVNLTFLIL